MDVHRYVLPGERRDGAPAPRVWRIATDDGVFWLAAADNSARLVMLPLPGRTPSEASREAGPWAALDALANRAEAEAGGRWVRGLKPVSRTPGPGDASEARP